MSWSGGEIVYNGPVCTSGPAPYEYPYFAVANWPGAHSYATSNRVPFAIHYATQPTTTSTSSTSSTTSTTAP